MNVTRGFLALLMLLSTIIIIFEWNLTAEAPHPGGGSSTIDLTDIYGSIGQAISEYVIYSWIVLVASIVGFFFTLPSIRRLVTV